MTDAEQAIDYPHEFDTQFGERSTADNLSGGHIDLWNKDTLTPSFTSFLRFRVGMSQAPNPLSWLRGRRDNLFSDLSKSKQILFWEVK